MFVFFCFGNSLDKSYAQGSILDTSSVNKKRIIIMSGSSLAILGSSYFLVRNSWWSNQSQSFHFDKGNDMVYAKNLDKAGHFMGGMVISKMLLDGFLWAGIEKKKSYWYSAFSSSAIQLFIELKDAYAPYWGFSKWDFISGSAGSFFPISRYYCNNLKIIDIKMSYFPHSNIYWDLENQRGNYPSRFDWHDDYPNQTYWISIDCNQILKNLSLPSFLKIALGFGIDETQYLDNTNTKMGGRAEFYLAIDYNIEKIFKKWNSKNARKIKKWINYIKFPAPTIRVHPSLKFYPFFM